MNFIYSLFRFLVSRPLSLVPLLLLCLCISASGIGEEAETHEMHGFYREGKKFPNDIKAVFTKTGENKWDVSFYFIHGNKNRIFKGTAEGDLKNGTLKGNAAQEDKKRTFAFTGTSTNGEFKGTHTETTGNKSAKTGTVEMTYGKPKKTKPPCVGISVIKEIPELDGTLKDPFWEKALKVSFKYLNGKKGDPVHKTTGYIGYTEKALYIGVLCEDDNMEKLKYQDRPRDNAVWNDDYVEIFLITDKDPKTPYHQFIFSPACAIYDSYKTKRKYNCKNLQVKTSKGDKAWTIEIAIPLEDLVMEEGNTTKPPYTWRLSINRFRTKKKGDDWEESAWSPTYKQSGKIPEMFGIVNIEQDPENPGVKE